jgi:hypothetical protein
MSVTVSLVIAVIRLDVPIKVGWLGTIELSLVCVCM